MKKRVATIIDNILRKTAIFILALSTSFIILFLLLFPFASVFPFIILLIFLLPFPIAYFSVKFFEKYWANKLAKKLESEIRAKEAYLRSLAEKRQAEERKLKAALIRDLKAILQFKELQEKYGDRFVNNPAYMFSRVDSMDGHTFEYWCADLLSRNRFTNVTVTPGSGDHGVDVLAEKDGIHYAIQCKCYSHDLGNTPVQEVYAGKEMYRCQVGVVMTNRYFTAGAKTLAEQTRVLLWDRDKLQSLIESAE